MATTRIIEVTTLAAEKLEEVVRDQGGEGSMLRVMVMPGPNGGMQYMLGVEKEPQDGDLVIDTETIQVLVDAESASLVEGSQIDYVDGLMRGGFVISNPNYQGGGGCACGGHGGGGGCACGGQGGGHGGGHGDGGCACGGH